MNTSILQHYLILALEEAGCKITADMHAEISGVLAPVEMEFHRLSLRLNTAENRIASLEGRANVGL